MYINSTPTQNGNYGNPVNRAFENSVHLPDEMLESYLDAMGFVSITVTDGEVTALQLNEAAYNAYIADHPITPPAPVEPTEEDDVNAMLIDHEYRLTLLELGL